ncbi:MAG TPA: lysis protein [Thiomicrospira sp.]|jgi:SlyX protein|nr:lysis protein [Thiomicrospira sp.]
MDINILEIKLAYQEESIENLSKIVALQQQDILDLKHKLNLLSEYIKTLTPKSDIKTPLEEDRPPHY